MWCFCRGIVRKIFIETPWKYVYIFFFESSGVEEYGKMLTRHEELNIPRIWGLFWKITPSLLNEIAYTHRFHGKMVGPLCSICRRVGLKNHVMHPTFLGLVTVNLEVLKIVHHPQKLINNFRTKRKHQRQVFLGNESKKHCRCGTYSQALIIE